MTNGTTHHTPADVRERVVDEIIVTVRTLCPGAAGSVATAAYAAADRILALLLRTPRGEGEAWRAFLAALDEFEAAANLWVDPAGPTAEDMERLDRARQRVIECARALATLRPEAQGEAEPVAWLVERRGVEMFGWHTVYVYLDRQNAENIARVMRDGEWDVRVVPLYRAALRSDAQGEEDAVRRTRELAVRRAYGCLDYRGGYRGAELEAFHAGIKTVIRALEAGPDAADTQAAALDRIGAALRSDAQGEEDEHASCTCEWMHPTLGTINPHWPAVLDPECIVHRDAARHSEAQGKDRWEDVVFGPITEAYNEAHAARPTDRSESDGE